MFINQSLRALIERCKKLSVEHAIDVLEQYGWGHYGSGMESEVYGKRGTGLVIKFQTGCHIGMSNAMAIMEKAHPKLCAETETHDCGGYLLIIQEELVLFDSLSYAKSCRMHDRYERAITKYNFQDADKGRQNLAIKNGRPVSIDWSFESCFLYEIAAGTQKILTEANPEVTLGA